MGGYDKKWVIPFISYCTLKSGALTNDLMNWADWLNDFCTDLASSLFCIFDVVHCSCTCLECFVSSAHRKSFRTWFCSVFFNKSWLKCGNIVSFQKNMGNDQKFRCSSCMAINPKTGRGRVNLTAHPLWFFENCIF